jgi:putative transcriptional regulator
LARALGGAVLALLLLGATDRGRERIDDFESHAGELLVADPSMPDPRFAQSVILMVSHRRDGAMGLIVNKTMLKATLAEIFRGLPGDGSTLARPLRVRYGGPVEPGKGFVLHSRDVVVDGTLLVRDAFALSSNAEIVAKIGAGEGPKRTLIAFGYAGWGPGQLEDEIARGGWHWAPADEELVFGEEDEGKWKKAMAARGIDL